MEKARLRLINPAGETTFRFAVGGHKLSITHSDGQPVEPVEVDAVRMDRERYDVIVEANKLGVWQVAAAPEGKNGLARAILRYEESSQVLTTTDRLPAARTLSGRLLSYGDLRTTREEIFPCGWSPSRP